MSILSNWKMVEYIYNIIIVYNAPVILFSDRPYHSLPTCKGATMQLPGLSIQSPIELIGLEQLGTCILPHSCNIDVVSMVLSAIILSKPAWFTYVCDIFQLGFLPSPKMSAQLCNFARSFLCRTTLILPRFSGGTVACNCNFCSTSKAACWISDVCQKCRDLPCPVITMHSRYCLIFNAGITAVTSHHCKVSRAAPSDKLWRSRHSALKVVRRGRRPCWKSCLTIVSWMPWQSKMAL